MARIVAVVQIMVDVPDFTASESDINKADDIVSDLLSHHAIADWMYQEWWEDHGAYHNPSHDDSPIVDILTRSDRMLN